MPLGSAFPPAMLRSHIEKQLVPGMVIRINVKFPDQTKPKFLLLVAHEDPELLTFIVNSKIHPFIQNRADLLQCQVSVDQANHSFLDHDSHLACHELKPMRREDVIQELMKDPEGIKAPITDDVKAEVVSAVKFSKTITEAEKRIVIAALGGSSGY